MANADIYGIKFPQHLGQFVLGDIVNNEVTQKGSGFTIPYNAPAVSATVYVYDKGIGPIPDRTTSEIVLVEFKHAIQELVYFIAEYQKNEIKLIDKYGTGSPQTGPEFFCAEFAVKANNLVHRTDLYLTGSRGHFVKIRLSHPPEATDFSSSRQFADEVARLLFQ